METRLCIPSSICVVLNVNGVVREKLNRWRICTRNLRHLPKVGIIGIVKLLIKVTDF